MSIYSQDTSLPYCTYITMYSGKKLPPFYIGHTQTIKILSSNYHGSVASKKYKNLWYSELKVHPHLFKTLILTFHESREKAHQKESYFLNFHDAKNHSLFVNRSNAESLFTNKGLKQSEEDRRKKSIAAKNRTKLICEYCGNKVDGGNFAQFHGKNCKNAPNSKDYWETISSKRGKAPRNWNSITCPHCNKTSTKGVMVRWHFDNCKQRAK